MRAKSVEKLLILLKQKALSAWGKAFSMFYEAYSSISERLLTKLLKKLLVVSMGA